MTTEKRWPDVLMGRNDGGRPQYIAPCDAMHGPPGGYRDWCRYVPETALAEKDAEIERLRRRMRVLILTFFRETGWTADAEAER